VTLTANVRLAASAHAPLQRRSWQRPQADGHIVRCADFG